MLMNSREMDVYQTKYNNLLEYYCQMSQMNNRLKHRLYHVRKEINHLKQLKRVLCERLLLHRAVIIDSNLEIPDNDSSVSLKDKAIGDVNLDIFNNFGCFNFLTVNEQTKTDTTVNGGNSRKRKLPSKKENGGDEQPSSSGGNSRRGGSSSQRDNKRRKARDDAKRNIISIIESIVSKSEDSSSIKSEPNECPQQEMEVNEVTNVTPSEQTSVSSSSNQNLVKNEE